MAGIDVELAARRVVTEVTSGEGLANDFGQGSSPGYGGADNAPRRAKEEKKVKSIRVSFLGDDRADLHYQRGAQSILLDISLIA